MRSIAGWIVVAAAAALFILFRPAILGGSTYFIFVSGKSMEPNLHTGDLAIVTPAAAYAVGDIVVYRPKAAPKAAIIHRIIGGDAVSGLIIQGDNRQAPDVDHPRAADLIGRAVLTVPGFAWVLAAIRSPLVMGALGAILALGLAWEYVPRLRLKT